MNATDRSLYELEFTDVEWATLFLGVLDHVHIKRRDGARVLFAARIAHWRLTEVVRRAELYEGRVLRATPIASRRVRD